MKAPAAIEEKDQYHSEEMQDIISAPPSWLIRWGMSLFFVVILLIVALSAFIRYPDIVKTQLKINSANAPKPIVTKVAGKLVDILVKDGELVDEGKSLAYLESTADHEQVLLLLRSLKEMQVQVYKGGVFDLKYFNTPHAFQLGEIQGFYQSFYQSYLTYKASVTDGFYLKKKRFLQNDLVDILKQREYLLSQKALQEKEYELAKQEYKMHKKLFEQKVIAQMELKREEAKFLSKQYPLEQTASSLLTNSTNYSAKEKEILELENQINEERAKFIQALNSLISEAELWKSKYVLSASQDGKVAFVGVLQENEFISSNQEIFYINSGNTDFFGEMPVPQFNMGKVKKGQEVLIKLKSYPYEEYGVIRGKIFSIADIPYKDSVFISKVSFDIGRSDLVKSITLKNGMLADAEIITEESSLLGRLLKNIIKIIE